MSLEEKIWIFTKKIETISNNPNISEKIKEKIHEIAKNVQDGILAISDGEKQIKELLHKRLHTENKEFFTVEKTREQHIEDIITFAKQLEEKIDTAIEKISSLEKDWKEYKMINVENSSPNIWRTKPFSWEPIMSGTAEIKIEDVKWQKYLDKLKLIKEKVTKNKEKVTENKEKVTENKEIAKLWNHDEKVYSSITGISKNLFKYRALKVFEEIGHTNVFHAFYEKLQSLIFEINQKIYLKDEIIIKAGEYTYSNTKNEAEDLLQKQESQKTWNIIDEEILDIDLELLATTYNQKNPNYEKTNNALQEALKMFEWL